MSLDPVKDYARLAVLVVVAVVVMLIGAGLFMGGRAVGKGQAARETGALVRKVAQKDVALGDAAASLRGAAAALRAVNREAQRAIDAAAEAKRNADRAGIAAAKAEHDAKARQAEYEDLIRAAKRSERCKQVLQFDVRKECGL